MTSSRSGSVSSTRASALQSLADEIFDVLIIGGGITGAGTARDAAMRGLRVALIEKSDFASGTSSKSSRLVHGGIRYLEHGQLNMVRESTREKKILLEIAPHLVKRIKFTWPVYRNQRLSRWKINLGLALYDRLAGDSGVWRHDSLDSREVLDREPHLNPKDLLGGASYFDAATDDSRLTLANILSAKNHGALVASYICAVKVNVGRPTTILARDELSSSAFEIKARSIVDATGPWAESKATRRSKGSHISVPGRLVGNNDAVTLLSPVDGRVMFVLPAGAFTIIGTTDTWTSESPDTVCASRPEIEYLLRSARAYFPEHFLNEEHVVAAWAGLRPLATESSTGNPTAISREHKIRRDRKGIVRVSGGKLTTYRSMAAEITDHVQRALGHRPKLSATDRDVLPGVERDEALQMLARETPELGKPIVPGSGASMGAARYAVTDELALTLSDILIRRTRVAFETPDHGRAASERVVSLVAPLLAWTQKEKSDQIRKYLAETDRIFGIDAG